MYVCMYVCLNCLQMGTWEQVKQWYGILNLRTGNDVVIILVNKVIWYYLNNWKDMIITFPVKNIISTCQQIKQNSLNS